MRTVLSGLTGTLRRLSTASRIALGFVLAVAVLGLLAPLISVHDPLLTGTPQQPPSAARWFGPARVGRAGFAWAGRAVVQYRRRWPVWKAPDEMVARNPELEPYSVANGGMEPGLMNPLGARALYLFQDGEDTLYRIHGNPEAHSIGKAVSSGCIRLLNHDIIDLHARVRDGSKVLVRTSTAPAAMMS